MTGKSWSSDFEPSAPSAAAPTSEQPAPQQPAPAAGLRAPVTRQQVTAVVVVAVLIVSAFGNHMVRRRDATLTQMGWSARDAGDTWPTPVLAASRRPLGTPRAVPADAGPYTFMSLQPGTTQPVTYDPCRPVRYVVNAQAAWPNAEQLVIDAVAAIADVTGLRFEYEGLTDEPFTTDRAEHQPQRYGDRWAPILVAWTDPAGEPQLAGEIAGVGGSTAVTTGPRQPAVYVSGGVALDTPQIGAMPAHAARAVIIHELAHVVGLAHVDDPTQLMHEAGRATELQPGDLAGLAQLGAGPCIRRL